MKTTTVENVVALNLTITEKEILRETEKILTRLQREFGNYIQLTALETGEIIEIDELARVKGILGGLHENAFFQYSLKGK